MAYTMKEFLLLDLEERRKVSLPKDPCAYCYKSITNSTYTKVNNRIIHIECYWDEFSNFLDQNPIGHPGIRFI